MSLSTPVPTNALHATVMEIAVKRVYGGVDYMTIWHYLCSRGGGWLPLVADPTIGDLIDTFWDAAWPMFLALSPGELTCTEIKAREVLTATLVGGNVVLDYGANGTETTPTPNVGQDSTFGGSMPSYVSAYVQKRHEDTPLDLLGSFRFGPISESWSVASPGTYNYFTPTAHANLLDFISDAIVPLTVPHAGSPNELECFLGILRKKLLVGQNDPWTYTVTVDEVKLRWGLGTQNTRKRGRGTYLPPP